VLVTQQPITNILKHKQPISENKDVKSAVSFSNNQELARLSAENLQAYTLAFLGKTKKAAKPALPSTYHVEGEIEDVVKRVKKEFQGKGLFDKGYIDWSKVGWENLQKEPLNWEKATDDEIVAFYHALALAETKDSPWVKKYNETNVPEPLATYHTIVKSGAKADHKANIDDLNNIAAGKSDHPTPAFLNQPLMKDGKFNLEFCVFDTETTGNRTDPKKGIVDKIIQIGAVKVDHNGVQPNSAVSQFVNPEMPVHPKAVEVHHITDEMLADKPVIEKVLNDFMNKYLQDQLLVAYNAKFDIPMLNRGIESYNTISAKEIKDSPLSLALDPYIIMQRLHPFLGASKKLSEQYKFLFANNMEGAHDALDDVKGTVDVLKYCCYYLQKHADRPLTVKDVLTFQFGGKVEGLDLPLNKRGYDASKSFRSSYRLDAIGVKNFPHGYKITETLPNSRKESVNIISKLRPMIGDENAAKLLELRDRHMKQRKTFEANLESLNLQPYDGKSVKEIIDTIVDESVYMLNEKFVEVWRKNIRTDHLHYGNDLPDLEVVRQVMKERSIQDQASQGGEGRDLETVLAEMEGKK
jgi:DNA polymerase III epsilon subunit family exonuclease